MLALHSRVLLVLLLILGLLYYRETLWRSAYGQISPDAASGGYHHAGHDDVKAAAGGWGRKESEVIRRRVVAVADLHGDLEHAHNVFKMAKLIDSNHNWIGGHDVLVSTGDIVDRGDDTIALYTLFDRLRSEAAAVGGEVRNCLGNHEIMNALGDWRYVTRGDVDSFGGAKKRREVMSSNGWIGQTWQGNFSITHTVPLLPPHLLPGRNSGSGGGRVRQYTPPSASFVHGGITPFYAQVGTEEINRIGKSLLSRALDVPSPNGHAPPDTPDEELDLYSSDGPLWYRGYATDENEERICADAERAAEALGVQHLVMGHTPHLEGFVVRCAGKVLLIDTGISKAYGGEQSALVLETELARLPDSDKMPDEVSHKYQESQTLTALYKGRRPKLIHRSSREVYIY